MAKAEQYDDLIQFASLPPETDAEVGALHAIARGGRALELGVGTGRVAIPLAATGVEVYGIELDSAMIDELRGKPGGEQVHVHLSDMADVDVQGEFSLVYAVFGTFFALPTQQSQVRCFQNVADHLAAHGRFVIEALQPRLDSYVENRKVTVAGVSDERVVINVSELNPTAQTITNRQLVFEHDSVDINPVHIRYSWPSELDLMAQLAGLRLHARWSTWDHSPFQAGDQRHISVYGP